MLIGCVQCEKIKMGQKVFVVLVVSYTERISLICHKTFDTILTLSVPLCSIYVVRALRRPLALTAIQETYMVLLTINAKYATNFIPAKLT